MPGMSLLALLLVLPGAGELDFDVGGPSPLVLGQVESVPVRIRAPEEGQVAGRPLRLSVNVGRFGEVKRVKPGLYEAQYTPPLARFPQVAFVAVWRETGPDARIQFFRIPLHARTVVPIKARSGSEVRVQVGDRVFGPVVARRGEADIEIEVPPGVRQVVVTSVFQNRETQATVDSGIPPYNRLTLAVSPYKIPADGESYATLHAFYDADQALDPSRLRLEAPDGELEPLGRSEQEDLRYRFVPARSETTKTITVRGRVVGDRASRASVQLQVGLPTPERIVATLADGPWVLDGETPYRFTVYVTDRLGLGVDGLSLVATSTATAPEVTPAGQGRYEVALPGTGPEPFPPDRKLGVQLRVQERPELKAWAAIPVEPAPWPTGLSLNTVPALPVARNGATFRIRVDARNAADEPYEGEPPELEAEGLEFAPLQPTRPGRFETVARLPQRRRSVDVRVASVEGRTELTERIALRRDLSLVTLGPRLGPIVSEGLFLFGGAEFGIRPGLFERRLKALLRASYWQREQSFTVEFADGSEGQVDARLSQIPISLGVSYDLWANYDLAWEVSALGTVAVAVNRVSPDFELDAQTETFAFGGFEVGTGLEWRGFVVDAFFGFLRVDEASVEAPDFYGGLGLGYRFGL